MYKIYFFFTKHEYENMKYPNYLEEKNSMNLSNSKILAGLLCINNCQKTVRLLTKDLVSRCIFRPHGALPNFFYEYGECHWGYETKYQVRYQKAVNLARGDRDFHISRKNMGNSRGYHVTSKYAGAYQRAVVAHDCPCFGNGRKS